MLCSEVPVTTVVVSPQLSSYSNEGEENRRKDKGRKTQRKESTREENEKDTRVISQYEAIDVKPELQAGLCRNRTSEI